MAEYIERKAVKEAIGFTRLHCVAYGENKSLSDVINEIPAADVEPVRHGRWEEWLPGMSVILTGEEMLYMCSNCTAKYEDVEGMKFCPNCGAKMDEEVD